MLLWNKIKGHLSEEAKQMEIALQSTLLKVSAHNELKMPDTSPSGINHSLEKHEKAMARAYRKEAISQMHMIAQDQDFDPKKKQKAHSP